MHHAKLLCPTLLSLCAAATACYPGPDSADALDTDGSTSDAAADTDAELPAPAASGMTTAGTSTTGSDPEPAGTTGSTPNPSTTSAPPDDDGSTGMVEMPCETQCISRAPAGWYGPELLDDSNGQKTNLYCEGPLPTLGFVGYVGLHAPPASCDCDCGTPSDVSCDGSVRVYRRGATTSESSACTGYLAGPYNPANGVVLDIPNISSSPFTAWDTYYNPAPHIEGGSCDPTSSQEIDGAQFTQTLFTCGAELDGTGCEQDQWCEPEGIAPEDRMCIWRTGDVECPGGSEYSVRTVTYQGFTDTRSCSSCSCGDPVGYCEDPSVRILSTQLFTHQAELDTENDCNIVYGTQLGNYDVSALLFDAGDPVASCTPSGGDPTGTVTVNGPTTLCCTG